MLPPTMVMAPGPSMGPSKRVWPGSLRVVRGVEFWARRVRFLLRVRTPVKRVGPVAPGAEPRVALAAPALAIVMLWGRVVLGVMRRAVSLAAVLASLRVTVLVTVAGPRE